MEKFDISIIMGSDSDLPVVKDCAKFLDEMGISYEMKILSVHRTPEKAMEYAETLKENGCKIIIAAAGGAAHLPGVFAALVPTIPVIGIPIHTKTLSGVDSLYSIVQMPSGIPVATVAINGAKNAAILATSMLAISDENLKNKLLEFKNSLKDTVTKKDEKLQNLGYKSYLENM